METKKDYGTELTAERSLEIITKQIEQNRQLIEKNGGASMIIWGTLVFVTALIVGHLWKHHGGPIWNILWSFVWIIGIAFEHFLIKRRGRIPSSFISKTIGQVWATFGIFCGLFGLVLWLALFRIIPIEVIMPLQAISITALIVFCMGLGGTITGFILKNPVIIICCIIGGIGGFFIALHLPDSRQMLLMAAVAVVELIIPGIIIVIQNRRHV